MPEERIRTVTATLVEPTTHKERKLRTLKSTYQDALRATFESGATTMAAVNDVVTPYDLPYQAKDALKRHVPTLLDAGTVTLDDAQPVRFTNRAAVFDHSADRAHAFCWQVPQAGQGTNFWIPLAINPAQRAWWHQLLEDDASAGQLQLVHRRRQSKWDQHVPLSLLAPETPICLETCTPVGFDVGEAFLLTGCALRNGRPVDPLLVDGGRAGSSTRRCTIRSSDCKDAVPRTGESTSKPAISVTHSVTRSRRRLGRPSSTPPTSSSR